MITEEDTLHEKRHCEQSSAHFNCRYRLLTRINACFFGETAIMEYLGSRERVLAQLISGDEIANMDIEMKDQLKTFLNYIQIPIKGKLDLIEIIQSDKEVTIVYEFCNNLSLYDALDSRSEPFGASFVWRLLGVLISWYYDHEKLGGVFHHNLKLESIFMHNDNIRIGGLDLIEIGRRESTRICGNLAYMGLCGILYTECMLTWHPSYSVPSDR